MMFELSFKILASRCLQPKSVDGKQGFLRRGTANLLLWNTPGFPHRRNVRIWGSIWCVASCNLSLFYLPPQVVYKSRDPGGAVLGSRIYFLFMCGYTHW